MQYIEVPFEYVGSKPSVFLAGGITGTAPWQYKLTALLCGTSWVVINPRRNEFPMKDAAVGREQIEWEFRHLARASVVAFWFPCETLCPITLYELGRATRMDKQIFVGTDPDFKRRFDLDVQLGIARPEVAIVDSLDELAEQISAAQTSIDQTMIDQPMPKETATCVP